MGVFRQKWDVNWILSHQNWRLNRQKWGYTVGLTNVNVENAWFSGRKMTSRLVCRRASRYLNEICNARLTVRVIFLYFLLPTCFNTDGFTTGILGTSGDWLQSQGSSQNIAIQWQNMGVQEVQVTEHEI